MNSRRDKSKQVRYSAADLAYHRPHPRSVSSGDEQRLRRMSSDDDGKRKSLPSLINSFIKGLRHTNDGFLERPQDFSEFIRASDSGDIETIAQLPLVIKPHDRKPEEKWKSKIANDTNDGKGANTRGWESMGTGQTYELEGPDPQALAMPPAPRLESDELASELVELYWMALCRDVPFSDFRTDATVKAATDHINSLSWIKNRNTYGLLDYEKNRKRGYFSENDITPFNTSNIFRGNIKGDDIGFYISQFLYVGNKSLGWNNNKSVFDEKQGLISYGSTTIDQRVRVATPHLDYMTNWNQWLDVQNGADLRELEHYEPLAIEKEEDGNTHVLREKGYRFVWTPRDLATWVHYDALHQAYFNACLILLAEKVPFDPGIPFRGIDSIDKQIGFATFGNPHILNLVSEVATRALKAVRYQKYSVHRRARPEQVAGFLHRYRSNFKEGLEAFKNIERSMGTNLLDRVKAYNANLNTRDDRKDDTGFSKDSWLLPMPFVEGSPMHPSYGSGHAAVAGACVTILKAFFDSGYVLPFAYLPTKEGKELTVDTEFLKHSRYTVEGELNKLAANISFGRNWAGVHWYSDQLESLRLGEQVALGILEEQKLTYGENFSMSVPLFDGTTIRI